MITNEIERYEGRTFNLKCSHCSQFELQTNETHSTYKCTKNVNSIL